MKSLGWCESQRTFDHLSVVVVVLVEPVPDLETAGADELAQRLEARLHLVALPAADRRAGLPRPARQLRL